jgi:hypothetical protein
MLRNGTLYDAARVRAGAALKRGNGLVQLTAEAH